MFLPPLHSNFSPTIAPFSIILPAKLSTKINYKPNEK